MIGFDSMFDSRERKCMLIALHERVRMEKPRESKCWLFAFLRFQLGSVEHAKTKITLDLVENLNITLDQGESETTFAMHVSCLSTLSIFLKITIWEE